MGKTYRKDKTLSRQRKRLNNDGRDSKVRNHNSYDDLIDEENYYAEELYSEDELYKPRNTESTSKKDSR